MKDFEGKKLRIIFNTTYGSLTETGDYLKMDNGLIALRIEHTTKIKYFSIYSIKSIEIVGESNE